MLIIHVVSFSNTLLKYHCHSHHYSLTIVVCSNIVQSYIYIHIMDILISVGVGVSPCTYIYMYCPYLCWNKLCPFVLNLMSSKYKISIISSSLLLLLLLYLRFVHSLYLRPSSLYYNNTMSKRLAKHKNVMGVFHHTRTLNNSFTRYCATADSPPSFANWRSSTIYCLENCCHKCQYMHHCFCSIILLLLLSA